MPGSWLLLVMYHVTSISYGIAQLGPYATRAACEHSRAIVQHTAAFADQRIDDGPLSGVCVPTGGRDAGR